jgi:hypothetical protein
MNNLIDLMQIVGASPELVNRLIPEHVRRQSSVNFMQIDATLK